MVINEDFFDEQEIYGDVVSSNETQLFGTKFMIVAKTAHIVSDSIIKRISYVLKSNIQIDSFKITDVVEKPSKKIRDEINVSFVAACAFKNVRQIYNFLLSVYSCVFPKRMSDADYMAIGYANHDENISGFVYDVSFQEADELTARGEKNRNVFNQWIVFMMRINGFNTLGEFNYRVAYSELNDMEMQFTEMCMFFMGEVSEDDRIYITYLFSDFRRHLIGDCIDAIGQYFYTNVVNEKVTSVFEDIMSGNVDIKCLSTDKLKIELPVYNNSKAVDLYFATAPYKENREDYKDNQYQDGITVKKITNESDIEFIKPFMWVPDSNSFYQTINNYIRIEDDVKKKHIMLSYVGYCYDKKTKKVMLGVFIVNTTEQKNFIRIINTIYKEIPK